MNGIKRNVQALARRFGLHVELHPSGHTLLGVTVKLIELLEVDLIVDVGANEGQYAKALRQLGYHGSIVSFEPVQQAFESLCAASGADPNWSAHQLALGEEPGTTLLHVSSDTQVSSFLLPGHKEVEGFWGDRSFHDETVEVVRADAFLQENYPAARRIMLKTDAQGFDMQVILGASAEFHRISAIQAELSVRSIYEGSVRYLDAVRQIEELGYSLVGFFPNHRDRFMRAIELDGLFMKPGP